MSVVSACLMSGFQVVIAASNLPSTILPTCIFVTLTSLYPNSANFSYAALNS